MPVNLVTNCSSPIREKNDITPEPSYRVVLISH